MKRRIFTSLLTIVFAFSMFTTAFANEDIENVTENIVTIYEETINEDNIDIPEEDADVEKTVESDDTLDNLLSDEPENNEEVQVYTIPILRDKEEGSFNQEISLMSLNTASLMSTNNRPVITGAYSQDFYADSDTFEIELYIENMSDTRQKLKLAVVDENDVVIAQQTGVYYQQNGLCHNLTYIFQSL